MIFRCLSRGAIAVGFLSLSTDPARAQAVQTGVEVLPFDAAWESLLILGPNSNQLDPASMDPDFLVTWNTPAYNGPAFRPGVAPFSYGFIDFFLQNQTTLPGSPLDLPSIGTRETVYFRTTINLPGDLTNAALEFIVDDGLILYVDGVRWFAHNMRPDATSAFTDMAQTVGSETTLLSVASGLPALTHGPHLVCASVHNQAVTSTDLGFMLRMTGDITPLLSPAMTAQPSAPSTDGSPRILLAATGLDPATGYMVQVSTDLANWSPVSLFPAAEERTAFSLDLPATAGRKYYRLAR